jgi:plasmid maintenance system antidote protein VapI
MNASVTAGAKKLTAQRGRMSSLPLNHYLTVKIAESGKTNTEIAEALGYPRPNVVAMLKTGSMKLPLNKVAPMAHALDVDPVFLMEKVMLESTPEMWEALKQVMGEHLVTKNEANIVNWMRKELDGVDPAFIEYKEFKDALKPLLSDLRKRENAKAHATLDRLEREKSGKKVA